MKTALQRIAPAMAFLLIATPSSAISLLDDVRYDLSLQRGLVAAGVLDIGAGGANKEQLEAAIARYREVFGGAAGDTAAPAQAAAIHKCEEDLRQTFGIRRDDLHEGRSLQLPTAILKATQEGDPTQTFYRSAGKEIALYTFRYKLRGNSPLEMLHAILAKARAPTIRSLEQSSHSFTIKLSDHVSKLDKQPTRHQLKSAYAADGMITGVYFTFLDDLPPTFAPPACIATLAAYWTPPSGLFGGESDAVRLEQVRTWVKSRKLSVQQGLDALDLAQSPPESRTEAATQTMLMRWTWRASMFALANIVTEQFEAENRWRDVEISKCYRAAKPIPGAQTVRVVFATNRQMAGSVAELPLSAWVDDSVESENSLSIGCASIAVATDSDSDPDDISTREVKRSEGAAAAQEFSVAKSVVLSKLPSHLTAYRLRLLDKERGLFKNEDRAIVFVHGYNTSFESALLRAAQIAARTDYDGRFFLFSWPTATWGTTYLPDLDSAERSESHLTGFLRAILNDPEIKSVDVVAHSMGSQMLVRALNDLSHVFYARHGVKLGQVLFAAPDVSSDVFAEKLREIAGLAQNVTVYGSSEDKALMISSALRGGSARIGLMSNGQFPSIDRIDFVDASAVANICNVWGWGTWDHSYFSHSPVMLKHMAAVLSQTKAGRALGANYVTQSDKQHSILKTEQPRCWFHR